MVTNQLVTRSTSSNLICSTKYRLGYIKCQKSTLLWYECYLCRIREIKTWRFSFHRAEWIGCPYLIERTCVQRAISTHWLKHDRSSHTSDNPDSHMQRYVREMPLRDDTIWISREGTLGRVRWGHFKDTVSGSWYLGYTSNHVNRRHYEDFQHV